MDVNVTMKYAEPEPVRITRTGVTFYLRKSLAIFYRWAELCGMAEQFLEDSKPYWWKDYMEAMRIQQAEEERRLNDHLEYLENRRLWQNEKKRIRRLREKENSVTTPDNAVPHVMG